MTRKEIIDIMKSADSGTIEFNGLNLEAAKKARAEIIRAWTDKVTQYLETHPNDEVNLVIGKNQVCAGARFQFLPALPRTGKLTVGSLGCAVDLVFFAFTAILVETIVVTQEEIVFQTKNNSVVRIPRGINQCDGCRRGMRLVGGIHYGEGHDMIACTKERY